MPAPDGPQFQKLYHGTSGEIDGPVVWPGKRQVHGPGAYATSNLDTAEVFAAWKAEEDMRLFGTVYEVGPYDEKIGVIPIGDEFNDSFRDPQGLRIKKAVSYPINPKARRREDWWPEKDKK